MSYKNGTVLFFAWQSIKIRYPDRKLGNVASELIREFAGFNGVCMTVIKNWSVAVSLELVNTIEWTVFSIQYNTIQYVLYCIATQYRQLCIVLYCIDFNFICTVLTFILNTLKYKVEPYLFLYLYFLQVLIFLCYS